MNSRAGIGHIVNRQINDSGIPMFRVLGQDATTGHWASFTVVLSWSEWERIVEANYNDREDIAQRRIC